MGDGHSCHDCRRSMYHYIDIIKISLIEHGKLTIVYLFISPKYSISSPWALSTPVFPQYIISTPFVSRHWYPFFTQSILIFVLETSKWRCHRTDARLSWLSWLLAVASVCTLLIRKIMINSLILNTIIATISPSLSFKRWVHTEKLTCYNDYTADCIILTIITVYVWLRQEINRTK